ncbi:2-C-methyl-D-erythritol 4-phosphate cytidylyltransferase [hydrothermal vent metagenome]|uniref:2-C-methyl-D-erythritol 4-phosphate cytidylyltransferase n=1 Tax=hydrothermal vent metagenome TaxID=652676 RepID=A0A3B0TC34_9ZZZZ
MKNQTKIAVIMVAGGGGSRARGHTGDMAKQYYMLGGKPVLAHALDQFLKMDLIDLVLPVIGAGHKELYDSLQLASAKLLPAIIGGNTRQKSSMAGLVALKEHQPDYVLIHDAARPFVEREVVVRVCQALTKHQGAVPVLPVSDTIKRSSDGINIETTENRAHLWAAQTPQGFVFNDLVAAYEKAQDEDLLDFSDDAGLAQWAEMDVVMVAGHQQTFKITNARDFERAEFFLRGEGQMETRVGTGIDIHQFETGDNVRLGGVDFAHTAKLKGHSDADAALHVLTDAILGALAEGDIGTHFPPGDPKWKDASSEVFLSFAASRVKARGGRIINLDLTIVCEKPKIGPKASEVQHNIARICALSPLRVSVKATTSEKMGFIGRSEGLMTLSTATIEVPRGED